MWSRFDRKALGNIPHRVSEPIECGQEWWFRKNVLSCVTYSGWTWGSEASAWKSHRGTGSSGNRKIRGRGGKCKFINDDKIAQSSNEILEGIKLLILILYQDVLKFFFAFKEPKLYVSTILDVHKKYNALVLTAFANDSGFVASLDKACGKFINNNSVTKKANASTKSPGKIVMLCKVHNKSNFL